MKGSSSMKSTESQLALITGGAGFIGSNLAERLLSSPGMRVRIFDNLSRTGVVRNLEWLGSLPGSSTRLEIIQGDVRDVTAMREAARGATEIYHLAAQVAVTTSVEDPATDFETNACGTFNRLEAARRLSRPPFILYTSTNKVYGSLESLPVKLDGTRYSASDTSFRGISEAEPLDFHSPYGCSKGAADQYVRDYARIYDLPTVVFRMSCIAGPRQFGNEDQGWVAHFLYSARAGRPITIYGNGYQIRDVLHVYDLLDAMQAARSCISKTRGQVYNLGGGMSRAISIVEMLRQIETITGEQPDLLYSAVRPGDQPLYISDTTKIERDTGWKAHRSVAQTLNNIHAFWDANSDIIAGVDHHASAPEMLTEEVA
jgi:CDP-paratose 2-epimerase